MCICVNVIHVLYIFVYSTKRICLSCRVSCLINITGLFSSRCSLSLQLFWLYLQILQIRDHVVFDVGSNQQRNETRLQLFTKTTIHKAYIFSINNPKYIHKQKMFYFPLPWSPRAQHTQLGWYCGDYRLAAPWVVCFGSFLRDSFAARNANKKKTIS